jgi:hypothetical protein
VKEPGPKSIDARQARLGKYELLRHLATGGMADIFLARVGGIEGFEKIVVIKRILPEFSANKEFVQLFLDEARLAATLHHPNIAQVYDVGIVGGQYFFAMEFVHGQDVRAILRRAVQQGRQVPLSEAISIILGVCAGLHYAHEKVGFDGQPLGIIHRDVSPSNIIVTYDGSVKLVDFGIAKATTRTVETRYGSIRGKLNYLSPEQCRCESLDRRADVFALAIVLYELSTCTKLYGGQSDFDTMKRIVEQPAPPPGARRPGYPLGLEKIVLKGLARNRDQRWQTAQELQLALEDFAREERVAVSPVGLARYMEAGFAPEITAWREAERQGKGLGEHLAQSLGGKAEPQSGSLDAEIEIVGPGALASQPATKAEIPTGRTPRRVSGELAAPPGTGRTPAPGRATGQMAVAAGNTGRTTAPAGDTEETPGPGRATGTATATVAPRGGARLLTATLLIGALALCAGAATLLLRRGPPPAAPAPVEIVLQVVSEPPGAVVTIDGKRQELLTPSAFTLARAPRFAVKVELEGYRPYEETVTLGATDTARALKAALVSLKGPAGRLSVRTNAPKGSWKLDGAPVGDGAGVLSLDEVAAGPHRVAFEAPGFEPKDETVEVVARGVASLAWELKPLAAKAAPRGAGPRKTKSGDVNDIGGWPPQ